MKTLRDLLLLTGCALVLSPGALVWGAYWLATRPPVLAAAVLYVLWRLH
ncbi:hypothetical protein [Sediminicurvatus halobius]|nr:hypothetical protein [Spiribacter halobius]UEX77004.1 hypothetical protein LMH63_13760 [Spiribacter halobius]